MTYLPSQGFRHAATLLLTNSTRAIPADASPDTTHAALQRLAHELVALADDTRAPADTSAWLIAEINTTIDRLPQSFDRETAKADAAAVLARVACRTPVIESRDLFLIYVPEDRLPIAAPLAIELAKRRVTVAFADFEVATPDELIAAVARGLAHHRAGVVLDTAAYRREAWPALRVDDRVRTLHDPIDDPMVTDLVAWVTRLRLSEF